MADLTQVFGSPFHAPNVVFKDVRHVDAPDVQVKQAMEQLGFEPPFHIEFDGQIHRFDIDKKGDKAGWYVLFDSPIHAGAFGSWKDGSSHTFRADIGRELTQQEIEANERRMAEARDIRRIETEKRNALTANTVEKIWAEAPAASADHPYLKRKGIEPHGARVTGDGRLVVPLYGEGHSLSSLQYIDADGGKLYHAGGKTGGKCWMIGTMDDPGVLYIAEGYATAATIHEATGRPCAAAYSASNLVPVCGAMREAHGAGQEIVIVADNDESGVGQKYADQASAKHGARVIMPPVRGDANDYAMAGNDLLEILEPHVDDEWLVSADDMSRQPAPIKWIVKNWVQENALCMIHGPSGSGKTFYVLDQCLRIASEKAEWFGHKTKKGNVVYLAGEGHHGLRGRIAAWKQKHDVSDGLSMWLSKSGCDLNTPAGYAQVASQIKSMSIKPDVIVVDTLHRFMLGDENSAQDAKTMLDACAALMREFGCTVILVHHVGVSEEAQHRARGSSAWRGALDIEVSVTPAGKYGIKISQKKSKDAELADDKFAELESINIDGWIDEDGEPVSSAVLVEVDAPPEKKKPSKLDEHRKTFENAWRDKGEDTLDGYPYLTMRAMKDYLVANGDVSTKDAAKQATKPSEKHRLIGSLINNKVIERKAHGWIVIDDVMSSALLLTRSRGKE